MFSCTAFHEPENENEMVYQEEQEMIDKVISEGMKLKKKCKSLSKMLSESEIQRKKDIDFYEKLVLEKEKDFDQMLNQIKTTHANELFSLKDIKTKEIDDLTKHLHDIKNESLKQSGQYSAAVQKALYLETEVNNMKNNYKNEMILRMRSNDNPIEKKLLSCLSSSSQGTFDEQISLRRAMISETEIEILQQTILKSENTIRLNTIEINQLKIQLNQTMVERDDAINDFINVQKQIQTGILIYSSSDNIKNDENEKNLITFQLQIKHLNDLLHESNKEILILKKKLNDLISSKKTVEEGVQSVLKENELLHNQILQFTIQK